MQPVYDDASTLVVLRKVEYWQWYTHYDRLDQFTLLVFGPYEVPLKIGIHDEHVPVDSAHDIKNSSAFGPNENVIDWVVTPRPVFLIYALEIFDLRSRRFGIDWFYLDVLHGIQPLLMVCGNRA